MLVKEANKEKINAMVKKAEGRSTARTIDFDTIVRDVRRLESVLDIPKKHMIGIKVDVDSNAQDFPNAYKYRPESTHYIITRKAAGWDISDIDRGTTRRANKRFLVLLTEDAEKAILESKRCFG